jgi:hypothetical protein
MGGSFSDYRNFGSLETINRGRGKYHKKSDEFKIRRMADLLPAEWEIFDLGEVVEVPKHFVGGNFCYHLCIWFLTRTNVDAPEFPNYNDFIRQHLEKLKADGVLNWQPPTFETTEWHQVAMADILLDLPEGTYLVHLLDAIVGNEGHWIVITPDGVFEPGTQRKSIPPSKWVSLLRNRFRVRRIFPVE